MFYYSNLNTVSEGGVGWMPDKEMKHVMKKPHHQKSNYIDPNTHLNLVEQLFQSNLIRLNTTFIFT